MACLLSCDLFHRPDRTHLFPVVRDPGGPEERWGYINQHGELVIGFQFLYAHDFCEDLAVAAADDEREGYIDRSGRWAIAPRDWSAWSFHEGRAAVYTYHVGTGIIDTKGNFIVPQSQRDLGNYSCGRAPFRGTAGWGYLDRDGNVAIQPDQRFQHAFEFREGLARVVDGEYNNAVIDTTGAVVIPFQPNYFGNFSEGLTPYWDYVTHLHGYVNRLGDIVIQPQFEGCGDFSEGVAAVRTADGWGYIDHSGAWVVPPRFQWAEEFSEGLAMVQVDTLWGYIDAAGNTRIEPRFQWATSFKEGLASVDHWSYIDTLGRYVWRQ